MPNVTESALYVPLRHPFRQKRIPYIDAEEKSNLSPVVRPPARRLDFKEAKPSASKSEHHHQDIIGNLGNGNRIGILVKYVDSLNPLPIDFVHDMKYMEDSRVVVGWLKKLPRQPMRWGRGVSN